jgi:hypothetical protein
MRWPLIVAVIALASPLKADEIDDGTKLRALLLGYTLNGNSMVRPPHKGSIDVSHLLFGTKPLEYEEEPPPAPPPAPPASTPPADVGRKGSSRR